MRAWCLAAAALLAGCGHRPPAPTPSTARYVVGAPYAQGGVWYYPREAFQFQETGLAEALPDRSGVTANGEAVDPAAMTAAHHTLQLPSVVRVTNLENGRQIEVRVDDRGPARPGRVLGLSPAAAGLLGIAGAAQIRLEVDQVRSEALRDQLQGGPRGVTAAPVAAVVAENLPAPGHAADRPAPVAVLAGGREADRDTIPERLPRTVVQGTAQPGTLWVRLGRFTSARYANALKTRLSRLDPRVRREVAGAQVTATQSEFVVEAGPFDSVAAADKALDQARDDGVTDAAIVVE